MDTLVDVGRAPRAREAMFVRPVIVSAASLRQHCPEARRCVMRNPTAVDDDRTPPQEYTAS